MKLKKLLCLLFACMLLLALAAGCGDGDSTEDPGKTDPGKNDPGKTDTGDPSGGEYRDLGGIDVTIGIWWTPDTSAPTTPYGMAREDYLNSIQDNYNFTIKQVKTSEWGNHDTIAQTSILSANPSASIITLDSGKTTALLKNDLFYNIATLPSFDPNEEIWNKPVVDSMTFDEKILGFAVGYEQRNCIYFNKNILEEAGIDPEEPYNMQAAGTWTWSNFMDMCDKISRSTDGTGIYNRYAICAFHQDTLASAVLSNGAKFVDRDENGRYFNASGTQEFLDAADFVRSFATRGHVHPQPEGTEWNWHIAVFNEGRSAFKITEEYAKSELKDVSFNWGMVFFPKGPNMDSYVSVYKENIQFIPSIFSAELADDIIFAYSLYNQKVPGFDGDDDWKLGARSAFNDLRAVDDTLTRMRDNDNNVLRLDPYVAGFSVGKVAYNIWNDEKTPAQLIEEAKSEWDIMVMDANALVFGKE
ncbi:MAG: extracellular solute-binding protein [Oscillospiraceae bacterium]|nr:extracellular solute-binding protein [Oscillospiraceae bacterium]